MTKISTKKNKSIPKKIYLHSIQPTIDISGFEFYNIELIKKIKNNSIVEISLQDALEYYNTEIARSLLTEVISKLEIGGKLHIQGLDLKSLCHHIVYDQIDVGTFKSLLINSGKKNIYSASEIRDLLSHHKVEITKVKFLNGLQYYFECTKTDE